MAGVRSVYGPFTEETPARFTGEVAIWARDDEVIGSETGSEEFPFTFELESSVPEIQTFEHCVGGEVRVEVELRAAILPGLEVAQFTATSELYEGTSCSTSDREDWGVETESIELLTTDSIDLTTRLVNGELLGGDEGRVDITIDASPAAVLERAADGGCSSCEDESSRATFEQAALRLPEELFEGCSTSGSPAGGVGLFGLVVVGLLRRSGRRRERA